MDQRCKIMTTLTKSGGPQFTDGTQCGKVHDKILKKEYLTTLLSDIKSMSDKDLEMKYPREFYYNYNKIAESKINSMHITVPGIGNLCEKNY